MNRQTIAKLHETLNAFELSFNLFLQKYGVEVLNDAICSSVIANLFASFSFLDGRIKDLTEGLQFSAEVLS